MKKNILFLLFILFITNYGCDDFLKEEPKSSLNYSDLDEEMLDAAVIGVYEPLTRSRGRLWESHYGERLILLEECAHSKLSGREKIS